MTAAKKKVTKITSTVKTTTTTEKSRDSAKSFLKTIEKNIIHVQSQLTSLSKLRRTTVQISNGHMRNNLQEPLTEKENTDLITLMKTRLKELNIKLSTTENKS